MSDREIDNRMDELVQREISRRQLFRLGGAGALSMGAAGFLAACGSGSALSGGSKTVSKVIPNGPIGTQLNFSNWPLYIDVSHGKHPTLEHFTKKFGVHVKYTEEINDNTEFFGKVRQQLANGNSGGRDIIVMTDWMAGKMIKLGYIEKLNKAALPNVQKNLIPALQHIDFDPNRDYSVPWQSGQTGLIVRTDKVGDVTSVNDIFNPKYKGKVTMLTEMRDSVGLTMLGMGTDPTNGTQAQMLAAVAKIDKYVKNGQIRRFTGNDYLKDLPHGDTWIAYGWSGDAVQLQSDNKNIKFIHPKEGFMLWTDNMMVPVGAPHAYTAEVFMNWIYQPEVEAPIEDYVNYVPPVNGTKQVLEKLDPGVAKNPLIFPSAAVLAHGHAFKQLSPTDEDELNNAFQKVIGA
ncbi:MAG TPA: spermidine/putrescine ABC transporter substrate-binding protein [Thermoleophilaceae bacterium]